MACSGAVQTVASATRISTPAAQIDPLALLPRDTDMLVWFDYAAMRRWPTRHLVDEDWEDLALSIESTEGLDTDQLAIFEELEAVSWVLVAVARTPEERMSAGRRAHEEALAAEEERFTESLRQRVEVPPGGSPAVEAEEALEPIVVPPAPSPLEILAFVGGDLGDDTIRRLLELRAHPEAFFPGEGDGGPADDDTEPAGPASATPAYESREVGEHTLYVIDDEAVVQIAPTLWAYGHLPRVMDLLEGRVASVPVQMAATWDELSRGAAFAMVVDTADLRDGLAEAADAIPPIPFGPPSLGPDADPEREPTAEEIAWRATRSLGLRVGLRGGGVQLSSRIEFVDAATALGARELFAAQLEEAARNPVALVLGVRPALEGIVPRRHESHVSVEVSFDERTVLRASNRALGLLVTASEVAKAARRMFGGGLPGLGGGGAGMPVPTSLYGGVTLTPGFQPTPEVLAGAVSQGSRDASPLGTGCVGWIDDTPHHELDVSAELPRLVIQVAADSPSDDTTLVVERPDGTFLCADDTGAELDPRIEDRFPAGHYRIYVGAKAPNAYIPYEIGFSEDPAFNRTTLRPPPHEFQLALNPAGRPASVEGTIRLQPGFMPDPTRAAGTSGGPHEGSAVNDREGDVCAGWFSETPQHVLELGNFASLRVMAHALAEGDDLSLMILRPDGTFWCDDDSGDGFDPMVEESDWPAGTYGVWVGSFEEGVASPYRLGVTELTSLTSSQL